MMNFLKNRANVVWLVLVLATISTFELGEHGAAGVKALAAIFGLAWIKGQLVIFDFMELRHAPLFWRIVVGGWLCVVVGIIALAYWIGMR
ncbi:MAG: cytochrome C oxidase subunit IV family protein [Betaproteobacteria bacterium]|nr:cytochrome C oxidase subunit IV family protein [Betaproteobacteria bacterium]